VSPAHQTTHERRIERTVCVNDRTNRRGPARLKRLHWARHGAAIISPPPDDRAASRMSRERSVVTQATLVRKLHSVGECALRRVRKETFLRISTATPPHCTPGGEEAAPVDHDSGGFVINDPLHSVRDRLSHASHEARPSVESLQFREPGTHVLGVNPQRPALGRASPARTRQLTR
jgi:hypothetical protein